MTGVQTCAIPILIKHQHANGSRFNQEYFPHSPPWDQLRAKFHAKSIFSVLGFPQSLTLDAVGTDWPQQFLLVLPKREEWRQESPEDSGRVGGGKMPRKGKGEWGHSRRGCSITLLPFMLWDRGSFAQFGVTAAVFAVAEPEFELSAALGNRKPHSLS